MYAQLCLILRPMGCSLPGSSVHGTLQARLPFPPPEYLPNPGIKPTIPASPELAGRFFITSTNWEAHNKAAAAAAAKSLQSCPTLCDPTDGSQPGSPVLGIFQARVLEWGATAFSDFDPYHLP